MVTTTSISSSAARPSTNVVHPNNGAGNFTATHNFADTSFFASVGDMNGDSNLDIVTGDSVFLNDGKGNL